MDRETKLAILADAAKYDASCASSGGVKRSSKDGKGIGSTDGNGICHSYAPDGRCISLLKILLTNFCLYECSYCVNRASSNVPRARFTVDEVVNLTLDFYRRNYIEGLFLSSGIIQNLDYTMEQLIAVARTLREEHDFRGYIHLKTIPDASPELIAEAGRYADRISINVELPTQIALDRLAPEKKLQTIKISMGRIREKIDETRAELKEKHKPPPFAPAGQSTQMIIGADNSSDKTILKTSTTLYSSYQLRRVYYSAFSPIPDASAALPLRAPPLMREHRLYQADWLLRFYQFSVDEIFAGPDARADGNEAQEQLDLDIDPKLAWALRHREAFPINLNSAPLEQLLRIPGLGARTAKKLVAVRRWRRIRLEDLTRLRVPVKKALPFIITVDYRPPLLEAHSTQLRERLAMPAQLDLFQP